MNFLNDFVADDLVRVDQEIHHALNSDNMLIQEVGAYLELSKGKKLRPILALLAAKAFGYNGGGQFKIAASLELVHIATLLHDDVIDKAQSRRGKPSVNAKWGDDVAILMADYLYASAFDLALETLNPTVLSVICKVTARMCEGELFQIQKRREHLTEADYLQIIRSKTAYLFSACSGLGGVLAGAPKEQVESLTSFGLNFGMAFQITDDTLDYVANDSRWGKDLGTDVAGGKETLPLIYTRSKASPEDLAELDHILNNGRELGSILQHINKYRGLDYCRQVAHSFAAEAQSALAALESNESIRLMRRMCDFVVERAY
ncbi:MAG: polyprenyl synthetase family protein [bacterium]